MNSETHGHFGRRPLLRLPAFVSLSATIYCERTSLLTDKTAGSAFASHHRPCAQPIARKSALTALTVGEQSAYCQVAVGIAETAVINGLLPTRRAEQLSCSAGVAPTRLERSLEASAG